MKVLDTRKKAFDEPNRTAKEEILLTVTPDEVTRLRLEGEYGFGLCGYSLQKKSMFTREKERQRERLFSFVKSKSGILPLFLYRRKGAKLLALLLNSGEDDASALFPRLERRLQQGEDSASASP